MTISSVQSLSRSVMSDSLRPHGLQHARPPCPSPTPGVYHIACQLKLQVTSPVLMLSRVLLFANLWTVARQAPLPMEFSKQECWSGGPFPTTGDLPHPGIKTKSLVPPALAVRFFTTVCMLIAQSYPTLCDPMDCSLLGSSVHGILQARILEWVGIPFSWGSSQPRDWNQVSCIEGRFFTVWATWETQHFWQLLWVFNRGENPGWCQEAFLYFW